MLANRSALVGLMMLTLAAATAQAQSKKELVAKVLQLQQPGIEAMAAAIQAARSSSSVGGPTAQTRPNSRARAADKRSWTPRSDMRRISPNGMPRWSMSSGSNTAGMP